MTKVLETLKREIEVAMKLLGVVAVSQLTPEVLAAEHFRSCEQYHRTAAIPL